MNKEIKELLLENEIGGILDRLLDELEKRMDKTIFEQMISRMKKEKVKVMTAGIGGFSLSKVNLKKYDNLIVLNKITLMDMKIDSQIVVFLHELGHIFNLPPENINFDFYGNSAMFDIMPLSEKRKVVEEYYADEFVINMGFKEQLIENLKDLRNLSAETDDRIMYAEHPLGVSQQEKPL